MKKPNVTFCVLNSLLHYNLYNLNANIKPLKFDGLNLPLNIVIIIKALQKTLAWFWVKL